MAHLDPLPADTTPELADTFRQFEAILGFVPNSLLTMQRRPEIVRGFGVLTEAVMSPAGCVDPAFKRLLAHFASRSAGCQYCQAHSLMAAEISGLSQAKIDDLWEYQHSPHYSEAERAALDFALAAGAVPNEVNPALMERMHAHWSEAQIVEMLAAVCLYGFLNRWNDSMATELEDRPRQLAEQRLAKGGWDGARHRPAKS
ncbi:MAG: carboxymuconolactone decarboxylase family protein [Wenzhouxiangella sp.]